MPIIEFLIFFPFAAALILLFMRHNTKFRAAVVTAFSAVIMLACIILAAQVWSGKLLPGAVGGANVFLVNGEAANWFVMAGEAFLMCLVIYYGIRYRKYYVILLSAGQTIPVLWLDLSGHSAAAAEGQTYLKIDNLTVMMCLIVGIVGGLICTYASGYIKDYHIHHPEYPKRHSWFMAMLFVFLGAMFGLLLSDNLGWIYFFWEITSVCSFLLIGYNKLPESINNSFRALWMNLLGGCGFAAGIIYMVLKLNVINLSQLLTFTNQKELVLIPVILLAFAALTKSAQMPFNGWLLGAMVAPTPTSALLHSATMVKAGVYLLIRLAPLMSGTIAGLMVTTVGGFTFFAASLLAISHSDGKRVLAHSTISNLGLITACAGIGLPESVWAGTMLILFHAVSKSLLFLTVGAVENATGSRNIEDMTGLVVRLPKLAAAMIIGICGMCLAPFGMLVAKWAALKAFVDAKNVMLILFLAFGSATTTFYWVKWLGKLFAVVHHQPELKDTTHKDEWAAIVPLACLVIAMMFLFPVISKKVILPVLVQMFGTVISSVISEGDMQIMIIMLAMIAVLPIAMRLVKFVRRDDIEKETLIYMNGANSGDDSRFVNSYGDAEKTTMSNWYMSQWFSDEKIMKPCLAIASFMIIMFLIWAITGGATI